MTDDTKNPGGWTGVPGYPTQADQDSAGHVLRVDGRVDIYSWKAFHQWFEDRKGRWVAPADLVKDGDEYLGQIITPAEVAAREAAAKADGMREAAGIASAVGHRLHGGPEEDGARDCYAAILAAIPEKDRTP